GFKFQMLPAGYNLFALSANNEDVSTYDNTKFKLVTGGNKVQVDTQGTGTVDKDGFTIRGVGDEWLRKLARGMHEINNPTDRDPVGTFPLGTTITKVDLVKKEITLDRPATRTVPPGTFSFTFMASGFTSPTGTTSGTTITNIDPNVGIYLSPG